MANPEGHNSARDRYGDLIIPGDKVVFRDVKKIRKGFVKKLGISSFPDRHSVATVKEVGTDEIYQVDEFILIEEI